MRRIAAVIALAVAAATFTGGGAAVAETGPEISGSPDSVAVGEVSTITATGLGGLESAFFGLGDVSGAAMLSADGSTYDTSAEVDVSDGTATVSFMATEAGSYVVDVTNGETPLASTTITVTGGETTAPATPTSTPTTTPTATQTPVETSTATPAPVPAESGVPVWVVVLIVVLAVAVIAAILATVLVQSRRRRGSTGA